MKMEMELATELEMYLEMELEMELLTGGKMKSSDAITTNLNLHELPLQPLLPPQQTRDEIADAVVSAVGAVGIVACIDCGTDDDYCVVDVDVDVVDDVDIADAWLTRYILAVICSV